MGTLQGGGGGPRNTTEIRHRMEKELIDQLLENVEQLTGLSHQQP